MGARGPAPKPTAIKEIEGGRTYNKSEATPALMLHDPPNNLTPTARAALVDVAERLHRLHLMTEIDGPAFHKLCQAWADYDEACSQLEKTGGVMLHTDKGNPVPNPWAVRKERAWEQVFKMLLQFGMTPASRSRIEIQQHHGESRDAMEELLGDE